jgi:predicted nucleotidyltransferase
VEVLAAAVDTVAAGSEGLAAVEVAAEALVALAAAARVAVEPGVVGNGETGVIARPASNRRARVKSERRGMGPEKLINEFVERMRKAAGTNLVAAILYGSVAAGDYVADYSDVNLLYVLRDTSFASIAALAPVMEWWGKQKHRPPLLMGAEEMRRSSDVFSIEFLDMQRHYRVLWGEDILKTLEIPMRLHRAQVEYELREKTIVLRQGLLVASGSDDAKWELLLRSLPAFGTLFRHALIALGDAGTGTKREAAALFKEKTGIDTSVFGQLVDIRENRAKRNTAKVDEVFARYLKLVEQVTATVDKMLDPAA